MSFTCSKQGQNTRSKCIHTGYVCCFNFVLAYLTFFDTACGKRSSYYVPVPLICDLQGEHVQCNVLFPKQLEFLFCFHTDTSSASEDEGSLRRQAALSAALHQSLQNAESWINRSIQGSSTSSSASSTLSHGEGKGTSGSLADVFANTRIGRRWVRTEKLLQVQTVCIKLELSVV